MPVRSLETVRVLDSLDDAIEAADDARALLMLYDREEEASYARRAIDALEYLKEIVEEVGI